MSVIENSLAPGESVLIRARFHGLIILKSLLLAMMIGMLVEIAFFALVIVVQFISLFVGRLLVVIPTDVEATWLYLAGNIPFIVCGLILGVINYFASRVVLTNQRIFVQTGVFRRRLFDLSLNQRHFRITTPPLGRALGFKQLLFIRANGKPQRVAFVDKADGIEQWIARRPKICYDGQAQDDAQATPKQPTIIVEEAEFPEEYTARMLREASRHIDHKNLPAARRIVERLLQSNPDNANVWYMAGYLSSSPDKKRQAYERALEINPRHRHARQKLDALQ